MNDGRLPPALQPHAAARKKTGAPRNGNSLQQLLVWHRRIGLTTAIIVLLLSVSGLLLNHANRLGFDQMQVQSNWLLRWYGYPPAAEALSYRIEDRWISWTGSRLYLDQTSVFESATAPVGAAAAADGLLAIAFPDALLLITPEGAVVERIGATSLPAAPTRIGKGNDGTLLIDSAAGRFAADENLIDWQPSTAQANWAQATSAPATLREHLQGAERGDGLSAERVLQDLHSGRIFGPWGPWLMDAAAIAFIVLSATGFYYWWRRGRRPPALPPHGGKRRKNK